MSIVMKNARILHEGYDLSCDVNEVKTKISVNMVEDTCMGSDTRTKKAGLMEVSGSISGFYANEHLIDTLDDDILGIFSMFPNSQNPIGFSFKGLVSSWDRGAKVGDLVTMSAELAGTTKMLRTTLLHSGPRAVSGVGTPIILRPVLANEVLHAVLHVTKITGTVGITAAIESDDAAEFTTPTGRIAFGQITSPGAAWVSIAGPVADTFYSPKWTFTGTGTVEFTLAIGIES